MKGIFPILLALGAGASVLPALETAIAQPASAERIQRVIVYGKDPCPRGSGDEIVVCARRPDSERYRIPQELRDDLTTDDPESQSWAVQAQSLEYVGQAGIQSCSTVGPGGFTGCWEEMMRQARNDRRSNPENRPQGR
jgi:hypothetical protein